MAIIKELTNYDESEVLYPVTVAQAVYIDQNTPITNNLLTANDKSIIQNAQLAWQHYQSSSKSYLHIKINSTSGWMLSFTVNLYSNYNQHRIQISGYNYAATGTWHQPKAQLLSSTSLKSIDVTFAKDANNDLSVYLPINGNYGTALITDVVNGNTQVKTPQLFTLTRVNEEDVPTENITVVTAIMATADATSGVGRGGTGATTFASGQLLIGNDQNAIGTRVIKNMTTKGDLGWTAAATDIYIPTVNTLAYWNGRYNGSSSNLAYCVKGAFGNLATKDSLSKSDVGLGNVDNTSDLDKPISTATQSALDTKSPLAGSSSLNTVANNITFGDSGFYIATSKVASGKGKPVGWYRLFSIGGFASGTLYTRGGYNSGYPTNSVCAFSTSHIVASLQQLSGRLKSVFNKFRLVRDSSSGVYYLDGYQAEQYSTNATMSDQRFTIISNSSSAITALNPTEPTDDETAPTVEISIVDMGNGFGYLPLTGGTLTGTLTVKANQYTDSYSGALDMANSNIYGVNSIYTADASDNAGEGIHFYRDATHVDTLWMNGGDLLFVPNRTLGTSTSKNDSQKVGRFTANPASGQVVVTDGTTGGMKTTGYTIAQSVPQNAVFTDTTYTFDTGDSNGQIKVTPSGGTAQNISVRGLGALAFEESLSASDVGAEPVITGGAQTITSSNLTTGRALISNSSGKVAVSAVTSTELGYLDGVTSAIQTQLNDKAPLASPDLTGTPTAPTAVVGTNSTQIATTAFVNDEINDLEVGGRNLLKDSHKAVQNSAYATADYYFGDRPPLAGEILTLQVKGSLASTKTAWQSYNSGPSVSVSDLRITSSNYNENTGIYTVTGQWKVGNATNTYLRLYAITSNQSGTSSIEWVKLERGQKATDWTPAPEDFGQLAYEDSLSPSDIGAQPTIIGGATTITSDNLTENKALISNASGKVAVSSVTQTELGYLEGVTSNIQTQLDGKQEDIGYVPVNQAGDTMSGNLVVPAVRVANTYYGVSFGRTTARPKETIFHTGIKWVNSSHMPVIHITGYAYGLSSPVEFKIGFYIYGGNIGWSGVTNMGAWEPTVYLFKHTVGNVDYVSVGLSGECYYLQLSADIQDEMGKFGNVNLASSLWSWEFLTTTGNIPEADAGVTCIQVSYKANILNPSKVNGHTVNSDVPANAVFTDTKDLTQMTGTLGAGHGGTGQTSLADSANALINALSVGTSAANANDYIVAQYANGGTTTTTYHRRQLSNIFKALNYAASDSSGGSANTLKNFTVTTTTNLGIDTATAGGAIGYVKELTASNWNYNRTDGALYRQAYSSSWNHQIYGDYRTGQISVRGMNDGTWQDWRRILDETNWSTIMTNATQTDNGLLSPDDKTRIDKNTFYVVKGTQTATTAKWTGQINLPALFDGLTIVYYLPRTSASNATLNLTLSDNTTTGEIPIYVTNTTRMGTHYGAGATVYLTYWSAGQISVNGTATTENRWTASDYWNSNTLPNEIYYYNTQVAKSAIAKDKVIVGDENGYEQVAAGVSFDLAYPILYTTAAIAQGGTNYANLRQMCYDKNLSCLKSGFTSAKNRAIFLVVTISGRTATISSEVAVDSANLPTAENGKYYILLGKLGNQSTGANYFIFNIHHPIYQYAHGAFREISQYAQYADDASTVSGHTVGVDVPSDAVFTDTTALGQMTGTLGVNHGGTGVATFTSGELLIGNGANAISTRTIKNMTAKGNLGWTNANTDIYIPTVNTLAYWDGRYNSSSSNLTYCVKGAFGTLATKDSLGKSDVGLGNVDNKSSATIRSEITSSNVISALGFTPVSLDSDQTITGSKKFTTTQCFVQSGVTKGTAPQNTQYREIICTDATGDMNYANGKRLGAITFHTSASNENCVRMTVFKPGGTTENQSIAIYWGDTGNAYTAAPTPAATDSSTKIATTAYVKGLLRSGTANVTTTNCPNGCFYFKYV